MSLTRYAGCADAAAAQRRSAKAKARAAADRVRRRNVQPEANRIRADWGQSCIPVLLSCELSVIRFAAALVVPSWTRDGEMPATTKYRNIPATRSAEACANARDVCLADSVCTVRRSQI